MSDNIGPTLIDLRLKTIARLEELADEIDSINKKRRIAKITGIAVGILGTVVGVPLGITAIVLTGGVAAVPIGIVAASATVGGVGAAGGVTAVGADIGGYIHIKKKHGEAMAAVKADRAEGEQFLDAIKVCKVGLASVGGVASGVNTSAKIAGIVIKGAADDVVNVAAQLSKVAKVSMIAGSITVAVDVLFLPVYIIELVRTAKDIHREKSHEKAEEIREIVRKLREELPKLRQIVDEVNDQ